MAVDAIICGVPVKGMIVMTSKFKGFDPHAKEYFQEGAQIAFKHKDNLTQEQKEAIFPSGKVYNLTVQYPIKNVEIKKNSFTPSNYQNTILNEVLKTNKNIFIEALAGTGKTSTLIWLIQQLMEKGLTKGKQIIYLAFNKSIQLELQSKLSQFGMANIAKTTHAFGLQLLKNKYGNIEIDDRKNYKTLEKCICDKYHMDYSEEGFRNARKTFEYEQRAAIVEMVGYIKNWAIFPTNGNFDDYQKEEILGLIDTYDVEWEPESKYHKDAPLFTEDDLVNWSCRVVSAGIPSVEEGINEISYDDMLYLPLALNLPIPNFDLVFTDESQDFNSCQLLLLGKLNQGGARIVSVGDAGQAIYAFRGANCKAFDNIREMLTNAERSISVCELPINYRCDDQIIQHARQWVPKLQGNSKAFGTVDEISFNEAIERVNPIKDIALNDGIDRQTREITKNNNVSFAFLCRVNLPIIITAYQLIAKGKKICIIGRKEFGGPMRNLVIRLCGDPSKPVKMKSGTPTNRLTDKRNEKNEVVEEGFLTRLRNFVSMQFAKFSGDEHKKKMENLLQNRDCLEVIAERVKGDTVVELINEIDSLFSDEPQPGDIVLSTIHKAKGLEWDVVFVLRPDLLPHPLAKPNPDGSWSDEQQQEQNAQYICCTRARHRYYYVTDFPFGPKPMSGYIRPISPYEFDGNFEEEPVEKSIIDDVEPEFIPVQSKNPIIDDGEPF